MNSIKKIVAALVLGFVPSQLISETQTLQDFLTSVDRKPVSFTGKIRYDASEDSFRFYDENRDGFGVAVDAGRVTREQIENECENSSFMVSYDEMCSISAVGTVEIRGGRVFLSIDDVVELIAP